MNPLSWNPLSCLFLLSPLGLVVLLAVGPDSHPLSEGRLGAAYQTTKEMFFGLRTVTVTGYTDAVFVALDRKADRLRVQASVPVARFDSGNGPRDRHVAEILGAPEHPDVRFTSAWMPDADFHALLRAGSGVLVGQLTVGGQDVSVQFSLNVVASGDESAAASSIVEGALSTTFSALGISVPRIGPGGVVAAPADALNLFVRVPLAAVRGAEALPSAVLQREAAQ